jgi:23S rRNA pseudouridine1911/1915/1917 synthase
MSKAFPVFVYEDEHIFVVEKPWGLHSVQVDGGGDSLADRLLAERPQLAEASEKAGDAGLIHRLDFDTSGLLIGAKSLATWRSLHNLLQVGGIAKRYHVLLSSAVTSPQQVKSFIGSPYRGGKKVRVYMEEPKGKVRALWGETEIIPEYQDSLGNTVASVTASPARRHQVRVHSSFIGHPLVGDSLYGAKDTLASLYSEHRSFYLHCAFLSFTHPVRNEPLSFTSELSAPQPRS